MGIEWKGKKPSEHYSEIGARGLGGQDALIEIMEHVAEDGADQIRDIIMTTPSALVPGKDNRYWTGQMYDDVGFKDVQVSGSKVTAIFGWVGNVEDYYMNQEYGLDYVPTPMHALHQAHVTQREELLKLIREWTRR